MPYLTPYEATFGGTNGIRAELCIESVLGAEQKQLCTCCGARTTLRGPLGVAQPRHIGHGGARLRLEIAEENAVGTSRAKMALMVRRAVAFVTLALVAACSSEEQLNPQPLPPEDRGGASSPTPGPGGVADGESFSGNCNSSKLPVEGEACDATKDTTCSWAVTCPTGLVLPYEVTCTNGAWQVTNGCPEEGKTDARGCPARQPENGTTCSLSPNTFQCGYVLECTGYRKSALAQCSGNATSGTWSTSPLGTCD